MVGKPHACSFDPPWRLTFRLAVWAALLLFMALANSAVEVMDAQRRGDALAFWEPLTWELSSVGVILLTLPAIWWGAGAGPCMQRPGGAAFRSICWPASAGRYCTYWP